MRLERGLATTNLWHRTHMAPTDVGGSCRAIPQLGGGANCPSCKHRHQRDSAASKSVTTSHMHTLSSLSLQPRKQITWPLHLQHAKPRTSKLVCSLHPQNTATSFFGALSRARCVTDTRLRCAVESFTHSCDQPSVPQPLQRRNHRVGVEERAWPSEISKKSAWLRREHTTSPWEQGNVSLKKNRRDRGKAEAADPAAPAVGSDAVHGHHLAGIRFWGRSGRFQCKKKRGPCLGPPPLLQPEAFGAAVMSVVDAFPVVGEEAMRGIAQALLARQSEAA